MAKDNALQQVVLAALNFDPSVDATQINVVVEDGVVTLSGRVPSYAQKHAAEMAVAAVRGVEAVAEEIEVRLPAASRRSDAELALMARERLDGDVALPGERLGVQVERGWVTLTGEVDWRFQKELARESLRRLRGLVGISNQITIRSSPNASDIRDSVIQALSRCWGFADARIDVRVEEGRLSLSGTVRSPHERDVAASMAWSAPGVTEVENDIEIG